MAGLNFLDNFPSWDEVIAVEMETPDIIKPICSALASNRCSKKSGKTTAEKLSLLREFRQAQYEKLKDAVYQRRGWTNDGIPTLEKVKSLGIDFPEVLELLKAHGVQQ